MIKAKRLAPKELDPVVWGNMVFKAPRNAMGVVHAYIKSDKHDDHKDAVESGKALKLAWTKTLYTVKYEPNLEKDVQDVFFDRMEIKDANSKSSSSSSSSAAASSSKEVVLYLRNERGKVFVLKNISDVSGNGVVVEA